MGVGGGGEDFHDGAAVNAGCAGHRSGVGDPDKSGGFRFRLKAANGETIASSVSYKTNAGALGGVESVKKNAGSNIVDLTEET
ncbi:YegP family protein [Arthrobacter sp. SO3]|uniref:YegP family protein n=1 Tax=Arthrobacter sp. SO3 TaxID=1897057 RepID=UPI001CFFDD49|nr:DUF1508 domain-containing protein [Arthrobacter sp. SO3]